MLPERNGGRGNSHQALSRRYPASEPLAIGELARLDSNLDRQQRPIIVFTESADFP
jgi:hypothetical protein